MRPFFSFYGAKWRIATRYPRPLHDVVIEPFAGSAGYSVRYDAPKVILLDKSAEVAGTWRWLIRATPEEILALPDLQEGQTTFDLPVCPEARALIGFWIAKARQTPARTPSPWMRDGDHNWKFWGPEIRQRLAEQVPRIRDWEVREASWEEAPDLEATWFVDPPYGEGRGGHRYRPHKVDYAALAAWVRRRRGQVIACESVGASWLPFRSLGGTSNATINCKKRCVEVVWP